MSHAWIDKIFRALLFRTVAATGTPHPKYSSKIAFHKILKNEEKKSVMEPKSVEI